MEGSSKPRARRLRFGGFLLDTASGELWRGSRRVPLQEKSVQLLLALLEKAGQVVGREELRDRLWPGGLHVDYEQGLGNAVQKLRRALEDSADQPRFVETLPRRGYRFLAEVEVEPAGIPVAPDPAVAPLNDRWDKVPWLAAGLGVLLLSLVALGILRTNLTGAAGALDSQARETYLRARHFEAMKTPEGLQKSVEYFRQAIEKEPRFAQAWAGLADAYRFQGALSVLSREEAYRRSIQAARRAIELDDSLAEGHAALAETTFRFGPEGAEVEPRFLRAIQLRPDSAIIRQWHANYLASRGRMPQALDEMRYAQRLDPLSLHINVDLGFLLLDSGQRDQAKAQLRRTLELDPEYPKTHFLAGYIYWKGRDFAAAAAAFRRAAKLAPDTPKFLHAAALASLEAGRHKDARATLQQIKDLQDRRFVEPALIAQLEQRIGSASPGPSR